MTSVFKKSKGLHLCLFAKFLIILVVQAAVLATPLYLLNQGQIQALLSEHQQLANSRLLQCLYGYKICLRYATCMHECVCV